MLDNRANNVQKNIAKNSLEELQELVLGLNNAELSQLQSWLKNKENFSGDISNILPDAVIKSVSKDNSLSDALLPVIETAIYSSVQKNPKALADALFPIMGPAIRQSISDTFRKMIQSLNETLEKQFSFERIKWRFEALFSSKSYAEIVLLKGMKFNVISAMLIHKESGLLIHEVHTENENSDDADMISSMLKAVQDFVHDSFDKHINKEDVLDTLRLNELNIWIIDAPFAFLAIVFDGDAPESRREFFKSQLEKIHHKFGGKLKNFDGDNTNSTGIIPLLNECLIGNDKVSKKKKGNLKLILISGAILVGVIIWISLAIYKNIQRENFISKLKNIESVVVVNHNVYRGKLFITAMKDASLINIDLDKTLDSSKYKINWINYLSTNAKYILLRFNKYLPPEKSVNITMDGNTMIFSGMASYTWTEKAKKYSIINSGLFTSDFSALQSMDSQEFIDINNKIKKLKIKFKNGVTLLNKEQKMNLDTLISLIYDYSKYKEIANIQVIINLDIIGNENENIRFAKSRKRQINNYLIKNNIDANIIKYNILKTEEEINARLVSFKIIPK